MSNAETEKKTELAAKNAGTVEVSTFQAVTKYIEAAAVNAPPQIKPYIQKAIPILAEIAVLIEKAMPILQRMYAKALEIWEKLEPYKPELLVPSLVGLILCFFGGSFLTLIAAVEAYRMSGYQTTLKCIKLLIEDVKKVVEANKKDDAEDLDGDGKSDALTSSPKDLMVRKTLLFFRTVDPDRVTQAIAGITAGFLAVMATLKMQFAKAITLGNAIADIILDPAEQYVLPLIEKVLPPEYRKWAKPALQYSIKSGSISFAFTIQRVISAFHSAMRGGLMFSRNLIEYVSIMKYANINHEDTYVDEIVGYGIAILGLYCQLSMGFGLPFPLNILLLPFSLAETLLMYAVSTMK